MPVGTNGCHQGTESPATASSERHYPQGTWGYPEQPVRSRPLSNLRIRAPGRPARAPAPSDRRTAWMPRVTTPRGRAPEPPRRRDDLARSAPAWCRDVSGPGAADRPRPRSGQSSWDRPGGDGDRGRGGAGDGEDTRCGRGGVRSVPVPVSYLRVWMMCSRVGPGWPVASPVIYRTAGPVHPTAGGAAICPQAGLRGGGRQTCCHLPDVP
jgi:hypothetical protein